MELVFKSEFTPDLLYFYMLNSKSGGQLMDKYEVLSKCVYQNEIMLICNCEKSFPNGKKVNLTVLRVIRREKDGFIWEYQKSLELTNLSFHSSIAKFLQLKQNNSHLMAGHLGAYSRGGRHLFKIQADINFRNEHQV